ncbi:MAG: DNA polymerase III subunit delta [Cyclobacteriaceae bacterium]|nr:DNA polymerase III subunit delta [Cyclobacteriaceae bacterium]
MRFSSIPGLASTKSLLIESVKSAHAAHAQLFAGSEGALNLPLALAYATYLHCQQKGDDACGTCAACSKSLKYIHPDTHFVFPVSNVKNDKDEERFKSEILKSWRSFLTEQPFGNASDWISSFGGEDKQAFISRDESRAMIKALALKPFESPLKVMIIWQPELMHPSAANGILKILEEPAAHTYFILVTNAADQLLPTILSRTQLISIPLLKDDEIKQYLLNTGVESTKAAHITQLAEGNLNLALKLVDEEDDDRAQRFAEWMRACFKRNFATLASLADDYHNLDKLGQQHMLHYSMNMFREALLIKAGATGILRTQGEEQKFISDFSKVMDVTKIEKAYTILNQSSYHLERNGSAKMIFMDLSLQLARIINP